MASDFVLDWEKALGYKSDPFIDKVLSPASQFLVNRVDEKEKINWFFLKGYFYGSIVGENGVGKTTLLKWLEERLKRYNKMHCIYINAAVFKEQINIPQQILSPALSFVERHFTKPHQASPNFDYVGFLKRRLGQRSVAILIDNAHNLTDRNLEIIKGLREDGLRIHVIVAASQSDYEKSRLAEFGSDELNIQLRRLTLEESEEMIQRRVTAFGGRDISLLNDEALARIYDRADKNPRQFLHMCRDETIRALIHKTEGEKHLLQKKAKTREGHTIKGAEPMRLVEPPARAFAQPKAKKKGFLSVKFDMGKKRPEPAFPTVPERDALAPPSFDNKPNLFTNERYNQALIDRLASAKPKKKQVDRATAVSDIDRIIKEISNTMKDKEK